MSCQETSGFLFSHPCKNAAASQCQRCSKAVCQKHLHPTPGGYMCTTCSKTELAKARRERSTYAWDDDPFMYGAYYYDGYGFYGHGRWGNDFVSDFTEADGEAVGHEGEGDWEHDMGGS